MYIANVLQPLIDACQWILEFWHKIFGAIPFLGPNHGLSWALAVMSKNTISSAPWSL